MITMLVLNVVHVYLTTAFLLLTFIVNMTVKSCIDGKFRSSTYTERTLQVLLSTIYPITTKRRESDRSETESEKESQQKPRVYTIKESLGELKYYYTMNIVIILSTSVMYKILHSISKEYQEKSDKLQVPLGVLVNVVNPILLVGSMAFRAVHHQTDAWQYLTTSTTCSEKLYKLFSSTPRPKSSFRVEEEEEIAEREIEEEEDDDTNDQHDEEENQEVIQEDVNHETTDQVSSLPRAGPSNQEINVVIEMHEILAEVKRRKQLVN